jgi:hypothetical protein
MKFHCLYKIIKIQYISTIKINTGITIIYEFKFHELYNSKILNLEYYIVVGLHIYY